MICGWTYVSGTQSHLTENTLLFSKTLPLLISYPLEFSLTAPIGFCCSYLFGKCSCLRDKLPHQKKTQMKSSVLKGATSLYCWHANTAELPRQLLPSTGRHCSHTDHQSQCFRRVVLCVWHGRVSCFLRRSNGKSSQQGSDPLHYILSPGRGMTIAVMAQGHLWPMFCHILERNGSV